MQKNLIEKYGYGINLSTPLCIINKFGTQCLLICLCICMRLESKNLPDDTRRVRTGTDLHLMQIMCIFSDHHASNSIKNLTPALVENLKKNTCGFSKDTTVHIISIDRDWSMEMYTFRYSKVSFQYEQQVNGVASVEFGHHLVFQ